MERACLGFFPCILAFGYVIFKAIQWQRNKSKNKSEEDD